MMLSEHELFVRCSNILRSKYFDKKYSPVITFLHDYSKDHNALPKFQVVNTEFKTKFDKIDDIGESDKKWFLDTIEDFCRITAIEQAIIKGADMLEKGEYGGLEEMVKNATLISLQRDMGTDYFDNPRQRLERLKEQNGDISIGWPSVDKTVYQVGRGELVFFAAISGGGKSVALANVTVNLAKQNLNVIYVTLELSEELVAKRLDAMTTGISNTNIFKSMDEVVEKVESFKDDYGNIFIKYMDPGATPNDVRAYLREFIIQTGIKPDALVIDYMDLMHPDQRSVDISNLSVKDKLVSEAIRRMGSPNNFDLVTFSAAQVNRGAYGEEIVGMQHVAGGLSKFQTADIAMYINNTAQLRERGEIELQFLKTRNSGGVGQTVTLDYDVDTLVMSDKGITSDGSIATQTSTPTKKNNIPSNEKNVDSVKTLLEKMRKK